MPVTNTTTITINTNSKPKPRTKMTTFLRIPNSRPCLSNPEGKFWFQLVQSYQSAIFRLSLPFIPSCSWRTVGGHGTSGTPAFFACTLPRVPVPAPSCFSIASMPTCFLDGFALSCAVYSGQPGPYLPCPNRTGLILGNCHFPFSCFPSPRLASASITQSLSSIVSMRYCCNLDT